MTTADATATAVAAIAAAIACPRSRRPGSDTLASPNVAVPVSIVLGAVVDDAVRHGRGERKPLLDLSGDRADLFPAGGPGTTVAAAKVPRWSVAFDGAVVRRRAATVATCEKSGARCVGGGRVGG